MSEGKADPVTRLDGLRAAGIVPLLPDNPAPYLTAWLFELGPTVAAGMGAGVIEWQDISAWSRIMRVGILPWEARILRRLSSEYLAQSHKAEKPDCPAPWTSDIDDDENKRLVAKKVRDTFRAMMLAQGARKAGGRKRSEGRHPRN